MAGNMIRILDAYGGIVWINKEHITEIRRNLDYEKVDVCTIWMTNGRFCLVPGTPDQVRDLIFG